MWRRPRLTAARKGSLQLTHFRIHFAGLPLPIRTKLSLVMRIAEATLLFRPYIPITILKSQRKFLFQSFHNGPMELRG
jgi:hypothetical protein